MLNLDRFEHFPFWIEKSKHADFTADLNFLFFFMRFLVSKQYKTNHSQFSRKTRRNGCFAAPLDYNLLMIFEDFCFFKVFQLWSAIVKENNHCQNFKCLRKLHCVQGFKKHLTKSFVLFLSTLFVHFKVLFKSFFCLYSFGSKIQKTNILLVNKNYQFLFKEFKTQRLKQRSIQIFKFVWGCKLVTTDI